MRRSLSDIQITMVAPFVVYSGYGSMAEFIALGMARAGAIVNVTPLMIDYQGLLPETVEILKRSQPIPDDPVLFFHWPDRLLDPYIGHSNLFVYTMWESNRVPLAWIEKLNHARAVITPSRFAARVFEQSGVEVPIHVVPLGIDPDIYPYVERPLRPSITTLMVTLIIERKHWAQAVEAWLMAFDGDEDARLLIKSHFQQYQRDLFFDERIEYISGNDPTRGILSWYQQADILLALGSEGFGLPLVEGMGTGLPVVALCSEGQGDVCEDADGLLFPVQPTHFIRYTSLASGSAGVIGIPDEQQAATHLRWITNNHGKAKQIGHKASAWAHTHRNIWDTGPRLLEIIAEYL